MSMQETLSSRFHPFTGDVVRERRQHRRHELDGQAIEVNRWDPVRRSAKPFGKLMDLSASGIRIRTENRNVRADQQIRIRLELPAFAGISPFIGGEGSKLEPRTDWIGWVAVSRVDQVDDNHVDVAGHLVDMDEMDRGMLGLYLSTQPLAA